MESQLPKIDSPADRLIAFARGEIGKHPYVWGDKDPAGGLDCSGFTQWCFEQLGMHIGAGTWFQREYSKVRGRRVSAPYAAGDLLFWLNEGPVTPSHVGIATDEGTVIEETATYGNVVEVPVEPRWTAPYVEGWRLL